MLVPAVMQSGSIPIAEMDHGPVDSCTSLRQFAQRIEATRARPEMIVGFTRDRSGLTVNNPTTSLSLNPPSTSRKSSARLLQTSSQCSEGSTSFRVKFSIKLTN